MEGVWRGVEVATGPISILPTRKGYDKVSANPDMSMHSEIAQIVYDGVPEEQTQLDLIEQQIRSEGERPQWSISDMHGAEWATRKIAQIQQRMNRRRQLVQRELNELDEKRAKLNAYLEDANKGDENSIAFFTSRLELWAKAELAGTKEKSVKLPSGTLSFRKQNPEFTVNQDALLEHLLERNPIVRQAIAAAKGLLDQINVPTIKIRFSAEAAWGEIKKLADARTLGEGLTREVLLFLDGDELPGVKGRPVEDSFEVKIRE